MYLNIKSSIKKNQLNFFFLMNGMVIAHHLNAKILLTGQVIYIKLS